MAGIVGARLARGKQFSLEITTFVTGQIDHQCKFVLGRADSGTIHALRAMRPGTAKAHGQPVNVFGLFQFGPFMAPNHSLGELGSRLHSKIGKLMLLAIGLYIAGALKHHFIDGTVALRRILGSPIGVAD